MALRTSHRGIEPSLIFMFLTACLRLKVLMPESIYLWSVRLIDEPTNQIVAEVSGLVERVDPPTESFFPAQNGLWFDAIALVFEIDLSGRASITDKVIYLSLATSAGVE